VPRAKSTKPRARRKPVEHGDEPSLRASVRTYCVAEWKKLTGAEWSEDYESRLRKTLDGYGEVVEAYDALVNALDAASRIVDALPEGRA